MTHSEELKKEIRDNIHKWEKEPDSDLQLPEMAFVRYQPKKNYFSIGYLTMFGVMEFPLKLEADESDSESTVANEMEVEIKDGYSIRYNQDQDILHIRYDKFGFMIPLQTIRRKWDFIRK